MTPSTRLLVAVALATPMAACGGSEARNPAPLSWRAPPIYFAPRDLPNDRIVSGQAVNRSTKTIHLSVSGVTLVDARGATVPAHVVFLQTFTHRLAPYNEPHEPVSPKVKLLTGVTANVRRGDALSLTISWHQPAGGRIPVKARYPGGALYLPVRSTT